MIHCTVKVPDPSQVDLAIGARSALHVLPVGLVLQLENRAALPYRGGLRGYSVYLPAIAVDLKQGLRHIDMLGIPNRIQGQIVIDGLYLAAREAIAHIGRLVFAVAIRPGVVEGLNGLPPRQILVGHGAGEIDRMADDRTVCCSDAVVDPELSESLLELRLNRRRSRHPVIGILDDQRVLSPFFVSQLQKAEERLRHHMRQMFETTDDFDQVVDALRNDGVRLTPGEGEEFGVLRSPGKCCEFIPRDKSEIAAAAAGVRPVEILNRAAVTLLGRMVESGMTMVAHGHDMNAGQPIDGKAELARQQAISSATDMATKADGIAGASRQGQAEAPVELT